MGERQRLGEINSARDGNKEMEDEKMIDKQRQGEISRK